MDQRLGSLGNKDKLKKRNFVPSLACAISFSNIFLYSIVIKGMTRQARRKLLSKGNLLNK